MQFEPLLMSWSPDVATRLCLVDPNNPKGEVQLWDLRSPKQKLATVLMWPPFDTSNGSLVGNAGSVNSLCWMSKSSWNSNQKSFQMPDSDWILMTVNALGALPTLNGQCGTSTNPTTAEFLVVSSIDQALKASTSMDMNKRQSKKFYLSWFEIFAYLYFFEIYNRYVLS